jgi:hypothetical protein
MRSPAVGEIVGLEAGMGGIDVPADDPAGVDPDQVRAEVRLRGGFLGLAGARPRTSMNRIPAAPYPMASMTKATSGWSAMLRYLAERSMSIPAMSMVPSSLL